MIGENEALVNITWARQNGELPDPVSLDATDEQVRQWITEAVRGGGVPGITADPSADFEDYVVERFSPNDVRPHNLIQVYPKTPYGGQGA